VKVFDVPPLSIVFLVFETPAARTSWAFSRMAFEQPNIADLLLFQDDSLLRA